jgi:hypothetical protein
LHFVYPERRTEVARSTVLAVFSKTLDLCPAAQLPLEMIGAYLVSILLTDWNL